MDRYRCKGSLSITLYASDTQLARVRMLHEDAHPHVADISIPEAVLKLIDERKNSTPSDVCLVTHLTPLHDLISFVRFLTRSWNNFPI